MSRYIFIDPASMSIFFSTSERIEPTNYLREFEDVDKNMNIVILVGILKLFEN